jgi:hypothetical protein
LVFNTLAHPGSKTVHEFYNAWLGVVDYGACCLVTPHLNFVNNKTNKIKMSEYATKDWLDVPKGAQNGLENHLRFTFELKAWQNCRRAPQCGELAEELLFAGLRSGKSWQWKERGAERADFLGFYVTHGPCSTSKAPEGPSRILTSRCYQIRNT